MSIAAPETDEERKIAAASDGGYDAGTADERERCLKIAEEYQGPEAYCIADRIRRGVP